MDGKQTFAVAVDVGDNLTKITGDVSNLVSVLAGKLGTTSEKVFEFYTRQAYAEGWGTLIACIASIIFLLILLGVVVYLFEHSKEEDAKQGCAVACVFIAIALGCALFVTALNGPTIAGKIYAPQSYAVKAIMADVKGLMK